MDDRDRFVGAMTGAINAAKTQAAVESMVKVIGTLIGLAAVTFLVPLLAVYAWNGLTPDGWVDWSYLPTVAGLFLFRVMIHWVRSE